LFNFILVVVFHIIVKYIKSVDGFMGCYRGLGPRICQSLVASAVFKRVACRNPFLKQNDANNEQNRCNSQIRLNSARSGGLVRGSQVADDFIGLMSNTGWELISVTIATIASQPFYVIAVRSMAQFVGRETKYRLVGSF
jgi:carrier protein